MCIDNAEFWGVSAQMLSFCVVHRQFLQPKLRLKQSLQDCEVTNSHSTTLADLNIVERSERMTVGGWTRNTISNILGKET